MNQNIIFVGFMAATGASAPVAMAQDSGHAIELKPVTVTASPLNQSPSDIAQPASVLRGEELREKTAPTIGETLSEELGVSASDFGQGASRPVIRGLQAPRVQVLEDGISSLDVSDISPDHNVTVNPVGVQQIEILRGPSTLLYGSGAIGGVVNVVTDRIPTYVPKILDGEAEVHYGTGSDERTGYLDVTGGIGNFALHVDGLSTVTEDYDIPDEAADNPATTARDGKLVNSAIDTDSYSAGGSFVGDRGYIGLSINRYLTEYGIPGEESAFIDLNQSRTDVKGELKDPFPGFRRLKADFSYNNYEHTEFEAPNEPGTHFDNDAYESRVELRHQPLGGWTGAVGLQFQHRNFSAIGDEAFVPPTTTRALGGFIVEQRRFGQFTLQLGGRVERQESDVSAGNPDVNDNLYSVSGGAIYEFNKDYSVNLSATHSERAPAAQELYAGGPHIATLTFEQGDAGLDKEKANSLDLTLQKTGGRLTGQLNLFANVIDDFIYQQGVDGNGDGVADRVDAEGNLTPGGELMSIAYIQDNADFYGAEAETVYSLLRGAPGDLDVRLFADYVRGELRDGGNLPRITPLRFGGGLDYGWRQWTAGLDVTRVSEQDDTADLETPTDGYTLLEADVGRNFSVGGTEVELFLRGTNLLNEEARRHTSFLKEQAPLPGRAVLVGLRTFF